MKLHRKTKIAVTATSVLLATLLILTALDMPFQEQRSHKELVNKPEVKLSQQKCSNWSSIGVKPGFKLLNNVWGSQGSEQCIKSFNDGSVGWNWTRNYSTSRNPNYPEILHGNKPWGNSTESELLPVRADNIWSMEINNLELSTSVNGTGKWNTAFELWVTSERPEGDVSQSITDEIIIFLESEGMDSATLEDEKAVYDGCNTYSYYQYSPSSTDHRYHQFRVQGDEIPRKVNLKPFLQYILEQEFTDGQRRNHWVTGFELGNEYWDDTYGTTHVNQLDYSVNDRHVSLREKLHIFETGFCRISDPWTGIPIK